MFANHIQDKLAVHTLVVTDEPTIHINAIDQAPTVFTEYIRTLALCVLLSATDSLLLVRISLGRLQAPNNPLITILIVVLFTEHDMRGTVGSRCTLGGILTAF